MLLESSLQMLLWRVKRRCRTFCLSSGVTWAVADLILCSRARKPSHSAFISLICVVISAVVSELFSSFSSVWRENQAERARVKREMEARGPDTRQSADVDNWNLIWSEPDITVYCICRSKSVSSTCIELPAALRHGVRLAVKLWNAAVHLLQIRIAYISELRLRRTRVYSLLINQITSNRITTCFTNTPDLQSRSSACRRPSLWYGHLVQAAP